MTQIISFKVADQNKTKPKDFVLKGYVFFRDSFNNSIPILIQSKENTCLLSKGSVNMIFSGA